MPLCLYMGSNMVERNKIYIGNALTILKSFPDEFVDCVITSPPYYGLRDYGIKEQIGLEKTFEEYIQKLVDVFREVKRVLKKSGTFWLNVGDTYNRLGLYYEINKRNGNGNGTSIERVELPSKNLLGIPWRLAFALQEDGWILRQDIIWHKTNTRPESVLDRCTKAHEYVFLFVKEPKYYFDMDSIKEPSVDEESYTGRRPRFKKNPYSQRFCDETSVGKTYPFRHKRSVWTVGVSNYRGEHFATFPEELIKPMILAGCPEYVCSNCGNPKNWYQSCDCQTGEKRGLVLDPFIGTGTTGLVAKKLNRDWIGIELNPKYARQAESRIGSIGERIELEGIYL
ncbi:DNA-methyltransferase [Caldisericum sp.]|uniref:DNA-methyltransferase n=1 Tax=Caldisericum sp. TaxID=2499687 RepID=UPI003D15014F